MNADELKSERESLGYNITGMANLLNTPRGTYLKWERGERRVPGIVEPAIKYLWIQHNRSSKKK